MKLKKIMKKNENEKNKLLYLLLFASICLYSLIFTKKIKKNYFSEVLVLYHPYKRKRNKKNYPIRPRINARERARPLHTNAREMSKTTSYECKRRKTNGP